MPHRFIRCLAVFTALLAVPITAAGVDWQTDLDAALARAREERKLVILELAHDSCARCNEEMESIADPVWDDPAVAPQREHLIFVRLLDTPQDEGLAATLVVSIDSESKRPSLTLADAAGTAILTVKPNTPQETKANFVAMTLPEPMIRKAAILAAESRLAGKDADAESNYGTVLTYLREWKRAIDSFESAAKKYRAAGQKEVAQRMNLNAAYCWYRSGSESAGQGQGQWGTAREAAVRKATGHGIAANITTHPSTPEIEAEAWFVRGLMYMADAGNRSAAMSGRGPTSTDKEKRQALQALRKAYVAAPSGSPILQEVRTQLESIDTEPLPRRADDPVPSAVRLMLPARRPLIGPVQLSTESDVEVQRVDYYVDGLRVASSARKPFTVEVDLGKIPTLHVLKAVALDRSGSPVGEATQSVNDRKDAVHVAITAPAKAVVTGEVGVEATVEIPPDRKLRSVDFYFNDEMFGSLTAPPFRHALAVNGRFGYLRVVAVLEDGSTVEDARLVNAVGQAESVAVQGVTFIATVSDREGRRLDGLKASDFLVTEDGERVDASAVSGAVEDPVTIGFAVDSSDSMMVSLLYAKELATQFIGTSLRPNDRAFVVAFDTVPRLIHAASADAASLNASITELSALGGTSIFDGIVFALQQFQSIPGKKALVVVSDGGEGSSSATGRTCVRMAKALGIPIYGVSPPGGARFFNPLPTLAELTGGLYVYAPARAEFPALAARIRDEIRGQYLITFVSKLSPKTGSWRTLKVTAPSRPEAIVRTISGYYVK